MIFRLFPTSALLISLLHDFSLNFYLTIPWPSHMACVIVACIITNVAHAFTVYMYLLLPVIFFFPPLFNLHRRLVLGCPPHPVIVLFPWTSTLNFRLGPADAC